MISEAPTAAELQEHPVVQAAFATAWADSLVDQPGMRHEEGGFIYANLGGEVTVRRASPGGCLFLDLSAPPDVAGYFLVATYHTHPIPTADGGEPEPSADDWKWADDSGVPWFVVTEIGVFVAGPNRRVGGFGGPGGYPQ
ncbi:hypothetical protein [Gemmata sp.]|uniref:hypothetical protein n=1 Tax=Gemmata sp. TaxID=1914242 RepID=UPI003F6F3FBE